MKVKVSLSLVLLLALAIALALPKSEAQQTQEHTVFPSRKLLEGGSKQIGSACTFDAECQTGHCMFAGSPVGFCQPI